MNWEKLRVKFPVVAIHYTDTYRDGPATYFLGKQRVLIKGKYTFESDLPEELVFSRSEERSIFVGMKQGLAAIVEPGYWRPNQGKKTQNANIKILDTYPLGPDDSFRDWELRPKDPKLVSSIGGVLHGRDPSLTEHPARVISLHGGFELMTLPDSAHFTQSGQTYTLSDPAVAAYCCWEENEVYGVFEIGGTFQIKSLKVRKNTVADMNRTIAKDIVGKEKKAAMIHEDRLVRITDKVEMTEFPHARLAHHEFNKFIGWTPGTPYISIVGEDFVPKQLELERPVCQAWIEPDGLIARVLCEKNWICVLDLY